jgi:hypothetical protein
MFESKLQVSRQDTVISCKANHVNFFLKFKSLNNLWDEGTGVYSFKHIKLSEYKGNLWTVDVWIIHMFKLLFYFLETFVYFKRK